MFLAAGLGTRLRPFTDAVAKPMLPLMGVPIAQFAFDRFASAGVSKVVANVHWLPEATREGLLALERGRTSLEISDESALVLGSAGGPRLALARFEGRSFIYFNGDMLTDVDLAALSRRHEELRAEFGARITLAIGRPPWARGMYREIKVDGASGRVTALGEKRPDAPFFLGVAAMDADLFRHLPAGEPRELVPEVLAPAVARGEVGFHAHGGSWYDIGDPGEWYGTHLHLLAGLESGTLPPEWRRRIGTVVTRTGPSRYESLRPPRAVFDSRLVWYPEGDERPPGPRGIGAYGHWIADPSGA